MLTLQGTKMQRGYALCNRNLKQVLSIDKANNTFVFIDIDGTQSINKALCFYDKTEARNVQGRIKQKDADLYGETEIVNVARLYNKIL